ncbi:MAG: IS1595 family transposase [Desulfovibrionaceae bacterium]
MKPTNKYSVRSRISEGKFRELVRCFALDLNAYQAAAMTHLNRNTINRHWMLFRLRIAEQCELYSPLAGQVEVDESYFGPKRVRGLPGRGAGKKTIVFGILERNSRVYTRIVPHCARELIQSIIQGKVSRESVVHSDGYGCYDGLVDLGYQKHIRIRHCKGEFARGAAHINGIESFWSYAKRRLLKFHGVPQKTFYLHLKECEFRFNNRHLDLYQVLLKMCRERPLS